MWQKTLAFVGRHRKALVIALLVYVAAIALLVVLSQGSQTEPFLYKVN